MKLLIRNGNVIDPKNQVDGIFDLYVENGLIVKVAPKLELKESELTDVKIIDATGLYVMPGFIDLHVHLREPGFEYKETIKTGAMAAAAGGFTGVCAMPNTKPATDNAERIRLVVDKAKQEACVNVYPIGAITVGQEGKELTDMEAMVEAGAIAFSEDGKSVMDSRLYLQAMRLASELDIPIFAHCEDKGLVGKGVINEGSKSEEFGFPGISNAVEDVIVARDILLAKDTGARLHLCHCSTKDSVRMVKLAKEEGLKVSAEVCPHHFAMTEEEITSDDANYKMNPPLRTEVDMNYLRKGLAEDIMDVIATDHAPHSKEEKSKSILDAPFGIVGLETAFALTMTYLVKTGMLTVKQMVEKLSTNPAEILGIQRGSIGIGDVADLCLADPNETYRIDTNSFKSKGKNSPFDGRLVTGRIRMTIVNGEIVYDYQS